MSNIANQHRSEEVRHAEKAQEQRELSLNPKFITQRLNNRKCVKYGRTVRPIQTVTFVLDVKFDKNNTIKTVKKTRVIKHEKQSVLKKIEAAKREDRKHPY